ncbi:MAG: glycosyl transferase family 28 [Streptosporangiales bacterium]|nr:glycosyl transferase family 28 [Streptosporangiales bacterium]
MGSDVDGTTLLVASTGGHLEQLWRLRGRLVPDLDGGAEWVTFDTDQARSLLDGERAHFVRYVAPRDYRSLTANLPAVARILGGRRPVRLISTGAGIALPFFTLARALRVPCHYIESSARSEGPSFTGAVLSRVPGVRLYTQYPGWATGRWTYRGSVLDGFTSVERERPARAARVVVTLGTMRTYGFRRAVERLAHVLPEVVGPDADILWQVGASDVSGLPVSGRETVPARELRAAVRAADLVVTHAGIGSALMALEAGRRPVLLPRRVAHGEHVDDHQTLIAGELAGRGLAISREADEVSAEDLFAAMGGRVVPAANPEPFHLLD